MQTFNFFQTTLHLEDFSRCWIGSLYNLPKFNQFSYIPNTLIHIKESFTVEVPKSIVGNINYQLINYCHLRIDNLNFFYFVKQLKTEITQNNIMFYLEKDEYFSNNLNNGVEYKQTKGIIMGGYRGDAFLNYLNNTQNEMPSDFKKLNRFNKSLSQIRSGGEMVIGNAYIYLIYRLLATGEYTSPYVHVVKSLSLPVDALSLIGFSKATNIKLGGEASNVECVRAYIIPAIFFNDNIIDNSLGEAEISFNSGSDSKTIFNRVPAGTSKRQDYAIDIMTLHDLCNRSGAAFNNDIANGENIYLCTQNRKWKLPPYTVCHNHAIGVNVRAYSNYTVDFVVNMNDIDIILSGDFNNWGVESIAKDFEESIIVNAGIIELLENENLRKTNRIYQGIGIGMSTVSGVVNGIANPSSILGGVNGIINSTKGLVTDKAREQDLKNKYNVIGNSGGISNIEHCKYFTDLNDNNTMRGWYFAYKPYSTYRGNDGYLLYEQLQFGYSMPEHIVHSNAKPSTYYMNIVNNVLETYNFLPVFYPNVSLEVARTLYLRYQVGYDCVFHTNKISSQKFERALANGIIFYGVR